MKFPTNTNYIFPYMITNFRDTVHKLIHDVSLQITAIYLIIDIEQSSKFCYSCSVDIIVHSLDLSTFDMKME